MPAGARSHGSIGRQRRDVWKTVETPLFHPSACILLPFSCGVV